MDNIQLNIDVSKQNKEYDNPEILASKIWHIVLTACKEFKVPYAILSVENSNLVLNYPVESDLKSLTFECNCDECEVISIFSCFAEKSSLEGKIFCKKNQEIQLHFRY